jgi:hypothetical protein
MFQLTCRMALTVAVVAAVLGPSSARAELLGYDGFEAYPANQTLHGKTGGTGFTGAWSGVAAGQNMARVIDAALSYQQGDLWIQGGTKAVAVYGTGSIVDNVVGRPFASQTEPVYFSLLFMSTNAVTGAAFIQYVVSDDADHNNAGSIGHRSDTNNGFFARVRTASGDTHTTSGPAATAGETYFLVGRFSKTVGSTNYNRMEVWVNPKTAGIPAGSADYLAYLQVPNTNSGTPNLAHFLIRQANYADTQWIVFDELRIGTTYGDVVTLVPEPGSALMACLGLAGMLLLGGRRRSGPRQPV